MPADPYYKHSGHFSVPSAVIVLVASVAAGFLLACAYSYLILYIPIAGYITFLFSAGFGGILGVVIGAALTWQKVRNVWVAVGVTAAAALSAFYACWAVWIYAFLRRAEVDVNLLPIFLQPDVLWGVIQKVNSVGAWTLRSWEPTGTTLWIIWSIEALIIFGVTFLVALSAFLETPFCESCNSWCKQTENVGKVAAGDHAELNRRLEMKDFSFLEKLGAVKPEANEWFQLDLYQCPTCSFTNTLAVKAATQKVDKGGETSQDTEEVLDKLLLSASDVETVRRLVQELAGPPPEPAPSQG